MYISIIPNVYTTGDNGFYKMSYILGRGRGINYKRPHHYKKKKTSPDKEYPCNMPALSFKYQ